MSLSSGLPDSRGLPCAFIMTVAELRQHALRLPDEDRANLAVELWDSLGQQPPVPEWHLELVRERVGELDDLPPEERSTPWEEVRQRVFPQRA
jgi:hypothetical protein